MLILHLCKSLLFADVLLPTNMFAFRSQKIIQLGIDNTFMLTKQVFAVRKLNKKINFPVMTGFAIPRRRLAVL